MANTLGTSEELTAELKACAEAAIAKGFAIITLLPSKKEPWAAYSPNAWKSGGRSAVALRAWNEGHPANYGISCGMSNICVVDCDKGLADYDAFIQWRDEHKLPETYTVRTGRRSSYGVQMYYTGAIATAGFKIGDVTGELKSIGGYVVGPGSVHPDSGEKYEVLIDASLAQLPEGIAALVVEKKKIEFTPKTAGGDLIPAGNRWANCQSMAGKFRNAGLDEEGIYQALRNFLKNNCEDGENYPDEKIVALAAAAIKKFDATEIEPVVYCGGGEDKEKAQEVPPADPDPVLNGDWLGELTNALTKKTGVPPTFVRAQIKTIVGATLDGMVGFPGEETLHTRVWTMLISKRPQTGKGESWKRVRTHALVPYVTATGLAELHSGLVSSGENLVNELANYETQNCLVNFDEMTKFFVKAKEGSSLMHVVTELFEQRNGAAGSLANTKREFHSVGFNFTGGFTESSFDTTLAGRNNGGDGFLSRCCIEHSDVIQIEEDWAPLDAKAIQDVVEKMVNRWTELKAKQTPSTPRFVPEITDEAKAAMVELKQWFNEEINQEGINGGTSYVGRIDSHAKRDILLRTIMSDDPSTINVESVKRGFAWAKRQLVMRTLLYPIDKGSPVERMEQLIQKALRKGRNFSKAKIMNKCNVFRAGCGGVGAFNMAWKSLLQGNVLKIVGKTSKGTERWAMHEDFIPDEN